MSHDRDPYGQTSYHICNFNTAGLCSCGSRQIMSEPSLTAAPLTLIVPAWMPLTQPGNQALPDDKPINEGSPVGPGFVVYERARGQFGYDVKMARAAVAPGWRHLVQILFDRIEHERKWNHKSGFVHMVVTQVKQKFGALRIYWYINAEPFEPSGRPVGPRVELKDGAYDEVDGFVEALLAVSVNTCEACGGVGSRRGRGWILTLCDACDKKDRDELRALFEKTEQSE